MQGYKEMSSNANTHTQLMVFINDTNADLMRDVRQTRVGGRETDSLCISALIYRKSIKLCVVLMPSCTDIHK